MRGVMWSGLWKILCGVDFKGSGAGLGAVAGEEDGGEEG